MRRGRDRRRLMRNDAELGLRIRKSAFDLEPPLPAMPGGEQLPDARVGYTRVGEPRLVHACTSSEHAGVRRQRRLSTEVCVEDA